MNTDKHTPGPWGIEQTRMRNWIGPMRSDGIKVSEIVTSTEREGLIDSARERNDANARLIAAAPELLAALRATEAMLATAYSLCREALNDTTDEVKWAAADRMLDRHEKNTNAINKADGTSFS